MASGVAALLVGLSSTLTIEVAMRRDILGSLCRSDGQQRKKSNTLAHASASVSAVHAHRALLGMFIDRFEL